MIKKSRLTHEMTSTPVPISGITTTISTLSDDLMIAKINNATEGLPSNCFNHLFDRVLPASRENALTICEYISAMTSEINPSDHYRRYHNLALQPFNIL